MTHRLLAFLALSAACLAGSGGAFSEAQSDPAPWIGETGITETIADIMKRPETIGGGAGNGDPETREGRIRHPIRAQASSPQAPSSAASTPAPKISGPLSPQTAGTSFLGVQLSEAGFIPPDSMGDVGPSQILFCENGRIKLFDRSGTLGALNTTTNSFFNSVRNNKGTSDPHIRYDRLTGRWFLVMINTANTNNRIMLAVSSGPTITDSTSFTFFQFQQNTVAPAGDTGAFADYPTLGIDANALYIGANMFSGNTFTGTTGFVVRKSSILGAGPIVATAFRQLGGASIAGFFTPQGVDNDNPSATEGYFIGNDFSTKGKLVMRRISNPGTTPTSSPTLIVSGVGPTSNPMGGVPSLGASNTLDDLDDRLFAAKIRTYVDGGTTRTTLVCAHNIEVDASGVANAAGNRNGSRWYEIDNLTGSPSVRQSGTLFDPAATNPDSYWIPSVAISGQGHLALGCSVAGVNRHAEIAAAGRLRTDPLNTLQAPTIVQTSSTSYNAESSSPQRWGDFSHTSVDPNDNMTMWTFQEYCNATNSWGVRVIQLKAPPPATPSSSASVLVGMASLPVVITGTSVSGSEFYDPGSAFPNRIAASVSGGVVVNSITYDSPTQVTLDLNTIGGTPGAQNITITNPDGQTATGTGILTLMSNTSPSCVVSSAASVTNSSALTFTITFGRAVNGFNLSDPIVTNGTKTGLSGSGAVYTLQVTATAEGPVTCNVPAAAAQATDDAANNTVSNTLTVTYDATAPAVPAAPSLTPASDSGVSNSDGITNVTAPTFSGSAEKGSTVKLFSDGSQVGSATANPVTGVYSVTSSALGSGTHSMTVTATDVAGNASAPSTGTAVTIDVLAPTAPLAPTLSAASDSGSSNSDGITNVTAPAFTGTTEAGAIVSLFADATPVGTTTANGAGSYSVSSSSLAAGTYSFTVFATDIAGNASAFSTGTTVTIDTTAPGTPAAPTLTAASDSGVSNSDRITNVNAPTFTGTAEANSTVTLFAGASVVGTALANGAGAYTVTVSGPLADGVYAFSVKATDTAGNASASSGNTSVTIDTAIAVPPAPLLLAASDSGSSNSDGITNVTSPTFTGTTEPGAGVTLLQGATILGTSTANGSGTWSITSSALSEGGHLVHVVAIDVAGNTSGASAAFPLTIDTTAPGLPGTPAGAPNPNAGTFVVSWTAATDGGSGIAGYNVQRSINGAPFALLPGLVTGTSVNQNLLPQGTYRYQAQAVDVAGNTGPFSGISADVVVDTQPPAISTPDLDAAFDTGSSATDDITKLTTLSFSGTAEAGATVQLFVDGVAGLSTTATGGIWTLTAGPLAAGPRLIQARATDAVGNSSGLSAGLTVTIDVTAPLAPSVPDLAPASDSGTSNSDNLTSLTTLSFTGTAEAGSTVQLFVGAVPAGTTVAAGGNWTIVVTSLAEGVHSITARATDAAGNVSPLSGPLSVTIDTTPPTIPSVPDLSAGSDTGASSTDNLTSATSPVFTGTAEAGSIVTLLANGAPVGSATATAGGTYTVASSPLAQGTYSFTATAGDAAGNASAPSAGLSVTIDTSAPAAPSVPDLDPSSDSGSSNSDNLTNLTTLTFNGTAEAGASIQLFVDGVAGASTTAVGGTWTLVAPSLSPGLHQIRAQARDDAGNLGPLSAALPVTIDTTAPAAPSTPDLDPASDTGTSNSDNITKLTTLTFNGTAEAGATVQLVVDGVGGSTTTANGGGAWTIVAPSLSAGVHSISSLATDAAGNQGVASTALSVTIDSTAPAAPSAPDLAPGSDSGASNTDNVTNLTTLSFSGTAETGATVQLFVDGVGAATTTAAGGAWTLSASSLTEGVHAITAVAIDPAGNASSPSVPLSVTIDLSAPAAPSAPDLDAVSDTGTSSSDNLTKLTTLSFSGTAEAGSTVRLLVDGAPAALATIAGTTWTLNANGLSEGGHVITATATDAAGNLSVASAPLTVTVDVTAPAAPSVPDLDAASDSGVSSTDNVTSLNTLSFSGSAEAGATVQLFVDGVAGLSTLASGGTWTLTAGPLSAGVHSITARATDASGNVGAASAPLSVTIDATLPSAPSVPDLDPASDTGASNSDNLTKLTTLSFSGTAEAGATVRLFVDGVSAGSTVAAGGAWTIVAGPLSPGLHAVTADARDLAGNLSAPSGGLAVTIDTTPPIAPPAPTLDAASDDGASSTDGITTLRTLSISGTTEPNAAVQLFAGATPVGAGVADAAGAYTVVSSSLADGAYALTVTASDPAGNVSPASAPLSVVVDNTAPPIGVVLDGPGADLSAQNSTTTLTANWSGFFDPLSGILKYEIAIGTTPGGIEVENFVDVGTATSATRGPFTLVEGQTYYASIRATNPVGLQSVGTSNGVKIDLTAPSPPGSLAAIPGNQAATLAWTPSPSPDTAFYRLWWKAAAANWTAATLLDNLAGTSTTVTGLVNGSLYDFRLRAVDAAGNESTDLFASATPQPSIQIQGGGSFSTIQQAIDAAAPGQVVIVGPGTYGGDIVLHPGVSLEGYSPNYTILQGSGLGPVITVEGSFGSGQSSTISQLTVTGGLTGISTTSADLTVRNGVIHHVAGDGIQAGVASRLTAINVTTVSNTGDGIEAAGTTIIRNTLAGENGGTGFNVPLGASLSYNDAWGNTVDYTVGAGVSGNLSVAAVFTNEAAHDYTTPASSPTVDVGDPADDFSNEPLPNGGRIDQGAYGNTAFAPLTTNPPAATTSTAPGRRRGGGCGLLGLEALLLFILRRRRARAARPRTF